MAVDTIVEDPESIDTLEAAEDVLYRIKTYEREMICSAGVLLIQRRQFCGLYEIMSKEDAEKWLRKPVLKNTCEWGLEFYPRSYFEDLKEKLRGNKDIRLPQPVSWKLYHKPNYV